MTNNLQLAHPRGGASANVVATATLNCDDGAPDESGNNSFGNLTRVDSTRSREEPSGVDFVGPAKAVKELFSLSGGFNSDENVSVALHNLGNGTILLESADDIGEEGEQGYSSPRKRNLRRPRPEWSSDGEDDGGIERLTDEKGSENLLKSLSLMLGEEKRQEAQRLSIRPPSDGVISTLSKSDERTAEALIIPPSNALTVSDQIQRQSGQSSADDDCDDALLKLNPPQHYMRHVVSPPPEPRQYLDWRFKDMNLVVASDALICNRDPNDDVEARGSVQGNATSIVVRVEDAIDLKAQLETFKQHESRKRDPVALLPSSYADALTASPAPKKVENVSDSSDEEAASDENDLRLKMMCIPASNISPMWSDMGFSMISTNEPASADNGAFGPSPAAGATGAPPRAPVCTVLDTYLDNIMANVPQLALILQEHGYVQNIELLRTEDIPSLMMHPSTLGMADDSGGSKPIFSPEIVETNAAMLLRFLKTNCTSDSSTYLLHRNKGETSIQLFDISSISQTRQRKWVWWLALCSYRFACRLEQLQANTLAPDDNVTRRDYRKRQRSLLYNTLNLLEELSDMDGGRHETISAAVCEHLADSYLWRTTDEDMTHQPQASNATGIQTYASSKQPYRNVNVDCLNKAQDHLNNALAFLMPLLSKAKEDNSPLEIEALTAQLYGIHHKIINVCLRLADHHLGSYSSSNLIGTLRTAAKTLADAASLLGTMSAFNAGGDNDDQLYGMSIIQQHAWLWEYCGHFGRSFAADELWRDRGHTSGYDLCSLFREVEAACSSKIMRKYLDGERSDLNSASNGQVSLTSLCGVVILPNDFEEIESSVLSKEGCQEAIRVSKSILGHQTEIKRDARLVLVAACLCYCNSIASHDKLAQQTNSEPDGDVKSVSSPTKRDKKATGREQEVNPLLRQRLGDACNEIGKALLNESRAVLTSDGKEAGGDANMSHVSAVLLNSATFWFNQGLEQFQLAEDLRNLALLRCNLCMCCKIRANTNVILPGGSSQRPFSIAEQFLNEAIGHLESAHESLGQRDTDAACWDMVSEELASTLLVLGVRRRQNSVLGKTSNPILLQAISLTPGDERRIVEPMERSCGIYESLRTVRANHQAAAAHYQLALLFSKIWTIQRDEAKTKEKLSAAFSHFSSAYQYFFSHIRGNETTFVVLSLDLANLYSTVSGEECLAKALGCCLDTKEAFNDVDPSSLDQMIVLADNIESRVSKLLLSLVKLEKEAKSGQVDKYKGMYRHALGYKMHSAKSGDEADDNRKRFDRLYELLGLLGSLTK